MTRVLRAKQSALLQNWHNVLDEIVEGTGELGRQVEPVGRARNEPFLQAVGNGVRRNA
jgi:hypothetical protein